MKLRLRRWSIGALALALAVAGSALAQPARKVVIAHGSQQVEITHPGLYLGTLLGYAQEEGIELNVQPTQGSQQALQLLAAGRADFVQVSTETVVNARDQGVNAKSCTRPSTTTTTRSRR